MSIWLTCLFGIGLFGIIGFYNKKNIEKFVKSKVRNYALTIIGNEILENNETNFNVINDNFAIVDFSLNGNKSKVIIPYNKNLIKKSIGYRVLLVNNDEKLDITQKPGVKYPYTASEMGGSHFELNKHGNIITLNQDQLPFQ